MSKLFKMMVLLGIVFAVVTGCGPQESHQSENILEISPTWTPSPTEEPRPSEPPIPTDAVPSATTRPATIIPTVTESPPSGGVFVREGVPVPQPEEVIGVENAGQLVELARWGYGEIQQVIHSADGQLMLVQSDAGVYAYHVGTLDEVWRFQPEGEVVMFEMDQDGSIQVQIKDEWVYRLDGENGQVFESFHGEVVIEETMEAQPDHGLYHDGGWIFRSSDKSVVLRFDQLDRPGWLYFKGISPRGNYVVFTGDDGELAVYRISDGERVIMMDPENNLSMNTPHLAKPTQLGGPGRNIINTFVFTRSEHFFIAANGYGQIFFFDLLTGELHVSVHGNGSQLLSPPFGDEVIYFDEDTIEIYGIPSGQREAEMNFGFDWGEMRFSPGGTRIAQGGTLWNTTDGTFEIMPENEKVIGFSENGNYVYTIRPGWWWVARRTVDLVLHEQTQLAMTLEGERLDYSFKWIIPTYWISSPDGKLLLGHWYGTPYLIWSTDTGELVFADSAPYSYTGAAFSPDGSYLVEVEDDSSTIIQLRQPDGSYAQLNRIETRGVDIDFIGNEHLLMTDEIVRVYSLSTIKLVNEISVDGNIWASAVSPDGALLAVDIGGSVLLVDFETGEILNSLDTSLWGEYYLAFSPDGRYLAIASSNGVIRLFGVMPAN
jgi:WD40 repeat protein